MRSCIRWIITVGWSMIGEPDWQRAIDQTRRYHRLDAADQAATDSTPVCLTMEA